VLSGIAAVLVTGCASVPAVSNFKKANELNSGRMIAAPQTTPARRVRDPEVRAEIRSEAESLTLARLEADRDTKTEAKPSTSMASAPKPAKTTSLPSQLPGKKASAQNGNASMPSAPAETETLVSAGVAREKFKNQITAPAADSDRAAQLQLNQDIDASIGAGEGLIQINDLDASDLQLSQSSETPLIFDIPVTYNARVSHWIRYFQTSGRSSFRNWLQRSSRYMPLIQYELTKANMPLDLGYVVMIESGFRTDALSHAHAMGLWQFIPATGRRYGLKIDWWIDERRDFVKSTRAAIAYMTDLFKQFDSWYLVAASYNMGENGVRRLINKYGNNNFWDLAELGALPRETRDYVPKIIAATLISKAPSLYGFRELEYQMPLSYESIMVPGGTDLINLAAYLGVSEKSLKELNPELIKGFIPRTVRSHRIRVPKGSSLTVAQYIRLQNQGVTASN
jgi:membrane-bound lytic murein transglycosylase D